MTKPAPTLRRIAFLYPGNADAEFAAWKINFISALAEHGWTDGANLSIDWRFAGYDQSCHARLAVDIAQGNVELVATASTPLTRAVCLAAPTAPIVTEVGDPVGSGFATSLQRPGGNITGLSRGLYEKAIQQFELLRELIPAAQTLLVLRSSQFGEIAEINQCVERAAHDSGLRTAFVTAETFTGVETALANLAESNSVIAVVYGHGAFQFAAQAFADAAIRHHVATLTDERGFTEVGCLMSFSTTHAHEEQYFASAIDRILCGESPADIPFALPDQTELAVNVDTATVLGLVPSVAMLRKANVVIHSQTPRLKP